MHEGPPGSPLRGRYLLKRPLFNAMLAGVDAVLERVLPAPCVEVSATPRRLLLCNNAHLGDVLLASAVIPVLRGMLPACEIGFLCGSWSTAVLAGHPEIRRIHVVDHWKRNRGAASPARKLRRHIATRARALQEIQAVGYDLAIDLYPYFPNNIPLLWEAGFPVRAGYTSGGFGPLLTHPLAWHDVSLHVTQFHLALIAHVFGGQRVEPWANRLQPYVPLGARSRVPGCVVLHPGAGEPLKAWPMPKWRAVAETLTRAGEKLAITGSAGERRLADALVRGLPGATNLCGALSWAEFTATIREAKLLLAIDTVAGHVAAAVGTPAVVIGSGRPNPAHWRPRGDAVRVLTHPTPCAPCHRGGGCPGMECVRLVEVEEVMRVVQSLVAPASRGAA